MSRQALNPSCPQCGGPVDVPEGLAYARCGYCSADSFVDLSGALLHQVMRVAVPRSRVPGLFKARALEAGWPDASLDRLHLIYEPIWEIESPDGRRVSISARAGDEGRFNQVVVPSGERAFVDVGAPAAPAELIEPELAPESVAEVAARETGRPIAVKTLRLIHRPIYKGQLQIAGKAYAFELDALNGDVLDVDWPAKATYRIRSRAWLATAAMIAAAALLPLPLAVLAVIIIGAATTRRLHRPAPTPARAQP
ncbi:MAG: hypothetical protein JSU87_16065 [Gemmatimonadota bacterium]|nr:MAG: hypothetical protein JSU87_16065 [Gemmatimonadota bacterium]